MTRDDSETDAASQLFTGMESGDQGGQVAVDADADAGPSTPPTARRLCLAVVRRRGFLLGVAVGLTLDVAGGLI